MGPRPFRSDHGGRHGTSPAGYLHRDRTVGGRVVAVLLTRCLVALALVLVGAAAQAYGTVPSTTVQETRYRHGSFINITGITPFANRADSCAESVGRRVRVSGDSADSTIVSFELLATQCRFSYQRPSGTISTSNSSTFITSTHTVPVCTVGVPSGTQCVCPSGQRPNAGGTACVPYDCPSGFIGTGDSVEYYGAPGSGSQCLDGCRAVASRQWRGPDGAWWAAGPFVATGSSCEVTPSADPGAVAPLQPAPEGLEPGQCPGTVNGQPVVVPCGTSSTTRVVNNPDGSRSEVVRTCTGGVCVETTVNVDVSGGSSGGGSVIEGGQPGGASGGDSGDGFCAENPGSPLCVGGSWGGSCGAFTCDGDAVQCAMAREQHTRNCQLFEQATPQSDAGHAAVAGGARPEGHPALEGEETSLSFDSQIDRTNRLAGGAVADISIPVGFGPPVVIPLSAVTGELSILGYLLVGASMFWAAFIVFGRGK